MNTSDKVGLLVTFLAGVLVGVALAAMPNKLALLISVGVPLAGVVAMLALTDS